ncbi:MULTISPECIES: hypothetical protein [unclassified Cryobacterium]|nr:MULTISPECIES: hypothetical protein [unclassified Cryobacterium]
MSDVKEIKPASRVTDPQAVLSGREPPRELIASKIPHVGAAGDDLV